MKPDAVQSPTHAVAKRGVVAQARRLMQNLSWLAPAAMLSSKGGRDFGRQIEASLAEIREGDGVLRLQIRKRDAAVVVSVDHYEEMVRMKALCAELVDRVREKEIAGASDKYEALYQRITSPDSRRAADALFAATGEELRQSYTPGKTETL
ncbi:MAG TPA: hypothetical protein DD808_12640 [Halieaceae bacterium]|jgi:hypothetical protein|uniref:Antitoxin n=1 Tax=Haliea salexigens TaxID=287487 RepID=A0A3C1KKV9_9GAMM|nr:hypothetical protein [Haliea sp.]HAN27265.1 hypothetical protein [Haliea salexigens]HAN67938.1 hypothetical protein [Halieaceae bacterium]MAA87783.1 hypothetical protein [Haliea sp.]MAD63671.1 hypothetical protein [Haliea sp.]MAY92032.1 hypothetical protein [Haliea sp.]|tara:strand:- start:2509 stop:2961 length:453 start_codon:yes stop_codon:yes gene_type:complete